MSVESSATNSLATTNAADVNSDDAMSANTQQSRLTVCAVWALRIIVGAVFIFSGWAKLVDPWGGMYKFTEYLMAMDIGLTRQTVLMAACTLATVEFTLGILVFTGSLRRVAIWTVAVMMAVMTALSLWIWLSDPVPDCGCFGEALVISNSATFAKNIVIDILVALLLWLNRRVPAGIASHLQWITITVTLIYAVAIQLCGYHFQPPVDFRPYGIGAQLFADEDNMPLPLYTYERDGVTQDFSADNLPTDTTWHFVSTKDSPDAPEHLALTALESDITDRTDDSDISADDDVDATLIADSQLPGGLLLLVVPEPDAHGISRSKMANDLYDYQLAHKGVMAAVVATPDPSAWARKVNARYPVYYGDDTDIKQLARGNAALVMVRDNTVRAKIAIDAVSPTLAQDIDNGETTLAVALSAPGTAFVRNASIALAVLILLMMAVSAIHPHAKTIAGSADRQNKPAQ